MKLLVIDDDIRFTRSLYYLFSKSYIVHIAPNAYAALERLQDNSYDLILLDLGLPDISGADFYSQLRKVDSEVPVIVLSGQTDIEKKVDLLQDGVSDYLTKPIHAEELQARVQLHIRKVRVRKPRRHLVTEDLRVDTVGRTVFLSGRQVLLRAKEYAILECLISHAGQMIPKKLLQEYAWDGEHISTNTLQAQVSNLRRKIDTPLRRRIIHTIHGQGYRIDKLPAPKGNA